MNIFFILGAIGGIAWFAKIQTRILQFLHMAQLEKYQIRDYTSWVSRNKTQLPDYKEIYFAIVLLLTGAWCFYFKINKSELFLIGLWIIGAIYLFVKKEPPKQKKKFVFTPRAIRLLIVSNLLFIYLVFDLLSRIFYSQQPQLLLTIFLVIFFQVIYQFAFYIIMLGLLINFPIEALINKYYLQSAKNIVAKCGATVIGITGSYGKTSVKDILHAFLSIKYKTLKTPESFNTPMGICKIIRRDLRPEYEFFVVEMGARRRGEIKELCELVQPDIGVITAIGPQHLETFGSLENISQTKYELIESLSAAGISVLNGDDPICLEMGEKPFLEKKILFSIDDGIERKDPSKANSFGFVKAKNISVDSHGSSFILENEGNEEELRSPLLGYQNIYNILAASAVALQLGVTLHEIKTVAKDLKPTPHRLQLIKNSYGVLIIDDAFNSNPVGARMALDVLKSFKHGRKILVTPGFVELGDIEYEENKKLGAKAAEVCDFVIVVGKTGAKPLIAGLVEQGFSSEKIKEVQSLENASKSLQTILKPNDVVLFENDLPDNYL